MRVSCRESLPSRPAGDRRRGLRASMAAIALSVAVPLGAAELPYLLELPSGRVAVRYTPGSLDRAARVKDRFELLLAEIAGSRDLPLGVAINLLSREEWEAAALEVPYGLPAALGPNELAIAAWGDADTVALWRRLAPGGVPQLHGTPIRGTRAEAESLAALDLVTQVEVARLLLPAFSPRLDEAWWEPLCAHTLAWSAFMRYESARLPEVMRFFTALAAGEATPDDRAGGVAERLRQHARFVEAGAIVGAAEKKPPAKPFMKWLRKKGSVDTAVRLIDRYPTLGDWLHGGG